MIRWGTLLAVGLLALATALPTQAADRPNIIFLFSDDHATHAISAYGSKINQTPALDRLASQGMLFRNCFCTNSICAPSRAVILTGKHSHVNGVLDNSTRFDGSQQTLQSLLQAGGYHTAMIGKWHLQSDPTGFDHWIVLPGQGDYYNPAFLTPNGRIKKEGYVSELITEMAIDYMENIRDKDKPFFMMCQHKAPHRNWQPGPNQLTMYQNETIPEPDTLFDDWATRTSATDVQQMTVANHLSANDLKLTPPGNLTPEQRAKWDAAYGPENEAFRANPPTGKDRVRWNYQRYIKDYLRCVAGVDESIGHILDYLDEKGLADNTIVVYSSDQGFYLGDHGWYDKRWMYEESLRMPLIVRWPGVIKPGSENASLVQNLDFAPTLLAAVGLEIPEDIQGLNALPLLKGHQPEDWRTSIYYEYFEFPGPHQVHKHYGVRTDRHKLIYYPALEEWELFDLQSDPDELTNLYGEPQYEQLTKELKAELTRLRQETGADQFQGKQAPGRIKRTALRLLEQFEFDGRREFAGANKPNLVDSPHGKALKLPVGDGPIAVRDARVDPSGRPIGVGGWIKPTAESGIVLAQGGVSQGWALGLRDGKPEFSIRASGNVTSLHGEQPLEIGQWAHVIGRLNADGQMGLVINGKPLSESKKSRAIGNRPSDPLTIGGDSDTAVGNYEGPALFSGEVADLRVYEGELTSAVISEWMGQ